jgi:ATP-dependent Clp protease adaptor protein ClpS
MFPLFVVGASIVSPSASSGREALARRLGLVALTDRPGTGAPVIERGAGTASDIEPAKPKMYGVMLYNSHRMDGVIVKEVIQEVFRKTAPEATRLMLVANQSGKALLGVYSKEVAEMKQKRGLEEGAAKMQAKWGFAGDFDLKVEEQ